MRVKSVAYERGTLLSIILRVIAFILFIVAALNNSLFSQPPADLVAFGLAAWVLATLVGGIGPAFTIGRAE